MPLYSYRCESCQANFELQLKIDDRNKPELESCPICQEFKVKKVILDAPILGDPVRMGVRKPDNAWKETLQRIHEKSPGSQIKQNSSLVSI